MKRIFIAFALVLTAVLLGVHAFARLNKQTGYQSAIVLSVEKRVSPSNYLGGSPSDAPLQTETYSYDVGIRLSCEVYVGRYDSATDYLPSDFAPNHTIDVRLAKHIIYVALPEHDRDVKMGIVSHKRLTEKACPANG